MKIETRTEVKRTFKVTKEEDTILHKAYDILNHIIIDEDAYKAICGMRKVFEKMTVDVPTCPPTGCGVPSKVPARDEKGRFVKKETISGEDISALEDLLCGKLIHPEDLEDEEDEYDEYDDELEDEDDIDEMPEMKSGKNDYEEFIESCQKFIDALKG